ncbi:unnamed protein product [Leptosia nina]|uniref:Uncharacterized protein n=1 Tax=Leptosia nina TaxID=320188 RepID=A0AAV1K411_9NEOP
MLSPEELQVEVCHVLTNLSEITAEITDQESTIVSVKDDHVEKRKEVEGAVKEAKIVNEEKERLKADNVRLTAKRIQLTRQCKDAQARLDRALESQKELLRRQQVEEDAIEAEVGKSKLEEKIEELSTDIQSLTSKRDHLRNNGNVLI